MSHIALDKWEQKLRPQVDGVDLLGEVSLSAEEVRLLGRLVGDLVRREGWKRASLLLRKRYPCTYAVFLVSTGAYHYQQRTFWRAVRETTGLSIPAAETRWWGQLFEQIVQNLPVAQFPSLGGYRYIGSILAHSGIPDYCLRDFFDQFLQPLLTRPEYATLSTEEFIRQRLLHSSVSHTTDKPVLRFLQHGGPLAVDFVERCREMALRFAERGEVPTPEEVGLPPRVVRMYQAWREGRARPSLCRRATYRSPVLFLDPWGWGPGLRLPSQPMPDPDQSLQVCWRVSPSDKPKIPVEIRREERNWKTVTCSVPLPSPAPEYRVALVFVRTGEGSALAEETQREWRIPGVTEERPLLWFDPKDGGLIPPRDALPGTRLWLLRRSDVILATDPPDHLQVSEQFPRLPWAWTDFVGEEVDLSRVRSLRARWGDWSLEYSVLDRLQSQPSLAGSKRLPVEDGHPPLYVGVPPHLHIPILSNDNDPRLHRWHVEVWNETPALPDIRLSGTLADLRPEIREGKAVLDLRDWLGDTAMGTYKVKVRGPLGHRADLAFRILPALEMREHETLHLPEEVEEARLLVETDIQATLELQPRATDCQITLLDQNDRQRLYEVAAGVSRADFPLRFVCVTPQGDSVYVPLSVPIRRLRWMVVLDREQAMAPEWRMASLLLPLDALQQAQEPLLLVDLFGGAGENLEVTISLQDEEDTVLQHQEGRSRAGRPFIRFDLTAFLDTLRHASASLLTFCLHLSGLPDRGAVSYRLLEVTRHFRVQRAEVESTQIGDTVRLRLRWDTPVRVRHRLAQLWPVWRPWAPPLEIPIPDSAQNEHQCEFPTAHLPPGKYLLNITTRHPWETDVGPPIRPAPDDPTVIPVQILGDAIGRRLQELREQAIRPGNTFPISMEGSMETGCILRDTGQDALAREVFRGCLEHLDEADVEHILALVHIVAGDLALEEPLRIKLADARQLRRVIEDFRQSLLSESLYREYLAQLPDSSLWSAETCEILLDVDDACIRTQALGQLVKQGQSCGIHTLLRWLQEGRISGEEALALVEPNLCWVAEQLKDVLPHPSATDLLVKLMRCFPDRVPGVLARPGYWVRCVAGWGRVECIEGSDGSRHDWFLPSSPGPGLRLHVLLRACDPKQSERVIIDVEKKRVDFPDAKQIYTCGKCKRFSSRNYSLVTEEHDRAVHGGISPAFEMTTPPLRQQVPLEFLAVPPSQPWE